MRYSKVCLRADDLSLEFRGKEGRHQSIYCHKLVEFQARNSLIPNIEPQCTAIQHSIAQDKYHQNESSKYARHAHPSARR